MSLIERAADMLGPQSESLRKPSTAREEADALETGVMERAVSHKDQHSSFPGNHERTPGAMIKDKPALGKGHGSRTVRVDLQKLRQQNMITPSEERTPIAENFRRIKRHILGNVGNPNSGRATNLVMITSALPGEGKTFCTINLAISMAMEMDRTVLLVDADVAKPSITSALGIKAEGEKGLMDVLSDPGLDLASVMVNTDIEKLSILPAGTRHARATEVLASERMRVLLDEMAERYHDRVIIFDSPPLLVASESCVLASRMGQILVVVEAERTTEAALKDALSRIESSNVLGVLLNKGAAPGSGYYGAYGYGYGYS
jgi:protein-tyrosine kinase